MQKKATHITVSRSCGIIHDYARIRNPRLPRFLFGGGMVTLFLALLDHLPNGLCPTQLSEPSIDYTNVVLNSGAKLQQKPQTAVTQFAAKVAQIQENGDLPLSALC